MSLNKALHSCPQAIERVVAWYFVKDGFNIIDAHVHYAGIFLPKNMSIVDYMDANSIDAAIVNTLNTRANLSDVMRQDPAVLRKKIQEPAFELFADFRLAGQPDHEPVLSLLKQYPDRVIPFFWYNPNDPADPEQQEGLAIVSRALDQGFKGVKIQPAMTPCSIEQLFPVGELLSELGLPLYIHPNAGLFAAKKTEASEIATLARKLPALNIILGHAAYNMEFCIEALLQLQGFPNVFAETSQSIPYGIIMCVKILGAKRVLFGSDAPSATPFTIEYQKVALLDIPEKDKALVLGGNVKRLLQL
ncbi:MAG TPA: amidohydrolase family protein [Candidatus Lokiarchaeia archaeon]|nr:amidohydrolase family protein [Candidatus Lokiarchaeia archaeon]